MPDIVFTYKPLPVHVPFHESSSRYRMMFGAFGSGKTYGVLIEAIAWMLEYPGIRGAIARKTVPQLRDAEEPIFLELLPQAFLEKCEIRKSGGHIERIVFPNGSTVLFRSLDDPLKWRSLNLGFIALDEANEASEDDWNEIASRVRQVDPTAEARAAGYTSPITRNGMFGATNPAGHDWVWRLFHPDSPAHKDGYESFISRTIDNPYLPQEFVESLLSMPKSYIQRFVFCQFDDFAGRIYEEWNEERHLRAAPQLTREQWRSEIIFMGMDPGTRAPTAAVWVWQDKMNERLHILRDYEVPGVSAKQHADNWKRLEAQSGQLPNLRLADINSITQRDRGSGVSLQAQYGRLGFHFRTATNVQNITIPTLGNLIHQNRMVCSPEARATFDAIRDYQWVDLTPVQKQQNIEGPDTVLKRNTHLVEATQYVASRGVTLRKPHPYANLTADQAWNKEIHDSLKRDRRARLTPKTNHDLGPIRV